MRENFMLALKFVLQHEGGYTNDPLDPGGETKYGIAKRYHPLLDIKNLTEQQAADIYLNEYWIPACDILSFPKDIICFDTSVNMGRASADDCLVNAASWEDILFNRVHKYVDKVLLKPHMIRFFFGWMNRCMDLYRLVRDEQRRRNH